MDQRSGSGCCASNNKVEPNMTEIQHKMVCFISEDDSTYNQKIIKNIRQQIGKKMRIKRGNITEKLFKELELHPGNDRIYKLTSEIKYIFILDSCDKKVFTSLHDKYKKIPHDIKENVFFILGPLLKQDTKGSDKKRNGSLFHPQLQNLVEKEDDDIQKIWNDLKVSKRLISISHRCRIKRQFYAIKEWIKTNQHTNLSVMGFGKMAVKRVEDMLKAESKIQVKTHVRVLQSNDECDEEMIKDLQTRGRKILLVASFNVRPNILGEGPDYGELSILYEVKCKDIQGNIAVIYAGIPHNGNELLKDDELFHSFCIKLTRSQPKLQDLMDRGCFFSVTDKYKLNKAQGNLICNWLRE